MVAIAKAGFSFLSQLVHQLGGKENTLSTVKLVQSKLKFGSQVHEFKLSDVFLAIFRIIDGHVLAPSLQVPISSFLQDELIRTWSTSQQGKVERQNLAT